MADSCFSCMVGWIGREGRQVGYTMLTQAAAIPGGDARGTDGAKYGCGYGFLDFVGS